MTGVRGNVALAPLGVPFVGVKGTLAWCKVLTSKVSSLWVRLLCGEDAGSGMLAIMVFLIALGVALVGNGQRLHGVKTACC